MEKITLYYDEKCSHCARFGRWLKYFQNTYIEVRPLHSEGLSHPLIKPEDALMRMPMITERGTVSYGFKSIVALCRRHTLLLPLWPWVRLLDVCYVGHIVYNFLAKRRQTGACTLEK